MQSALVHVYSLHHLAHAGTRSAALLVGSGHIVPPHDAQSLSAHVSFVHHTWQPGVAAAALVVAHFGLLQLAQASTSQCASVHHEAQPSSDGLHFALAQFSQPSTLHVCALHHVAQPTVTGAAATR